VACGVESQVSNRSTPSFLSFSFESLDSNRKHWFVVRLGPSPNSFQPISPVYVLSLMIVLCDSLHTSTLPTIIKINQQNKSITNKVQQTYKVQQTSTNKANRTNNTQTNK
jgi:hypothetical protein